MVVCPLSCFFVVFFPCPFLPLPVQQRLVVHSPLAGFFDVRLPHWGFGAVAPPFPAESVVLFCVFLGEFDFDSELKSAAGCSAHDTDHVRDVQCVRPSRDDPGCIVSVRFETYDGFRDENLRHFIAHCSLFELEVAPEERDVLLVNVVLGPHVVVNWFFLC